MNKKIDWLDKFANDEYEKMKKTASKTVANQIIVNCSDYPNAKVNSLVDYNNKKYKVIDTKYCDAAGPGIILEKVADSLEMPEDTNVVSGTVPATTEKGCNCGTCKTAAVITDEAKEEVEGIDSRSEYPETIAKPGGLKAFPSAKLAPPPRKITDPPYHPTTDIGNDAALDTDEMNQFFVDAADRTLETIKKEDSQDRTTVEGYFTWNQFLDNLLDEEEDALANFDDSKANVEDEEDSIDVEDEVDEPIEEDAELDEATEDDIPEDFDEDLELDEPTDEANDEDIDETDEPETDDIDEAVNRILDEDDDTESIDEDEDETEDDIDDEDLELDDIDEELDDEDDEENKKEASLNRSRFQKVAKSLNLK